jgi:subtilisin family serine protease
MNIIYKRLNSAAIASLVAVMVFFMGGQAGAAEPDLAKVIDSELVAKANQGETVDIIVLLKGYKNYVGRIKSDDKARMVSAQTQIQSQQAAVLNQLASSAFTLRHQFENILGFSGSIDADGLVALAAMPEVEAIEEDGRAEAHLNQGIPLMNALADRSSYDGTGVSVAIVDTGIDYNHAMLGGSGFPNSKVIGGYDFGDSDTDPMDCHSHGTACAGITSGTLASGPGDYIGGVAHNSKLYALKIVSGCSGWAYYSTMAAAWDWAVSHKYDDPSNPILIISTSFGGGYYTSACDASQPTLAAAADNAVANGITVFCSSGNDGYADGMGAPACVSNAISVGAVYDDNLGSKYWSVCTDLTTAADQVTCYSNSATFLDILGPSNDCYTTGLYGGYTSSFGGTSAACPYSAGGAAMLQHYAKATTGSFYTPAQIKAALIDNGDPITDAKSGITKPRVNVGDAIGTPPPVWSYCIKDTQFTPELWVNLEYDNLLVRGQAIASSSSFPAPITGSYLANPNELLFSVDYLVVNQVRFYRINATTFTGETWSVGPDGSFFDLPHPATIEFCPTEASESTTGETGVAK